MQYCGAHGMEFYVHDFLKYIIERPLDWEIKDARRGDTCLKECWQRLSFITQANITIFILGSASSGECMVCRGCAISMIPGHL